MDKLGRATKDPVDTANQAVQKMVASAKNAWKPQLPQSQPAPDDPSEFYKVLQGKPQRVIQQAFLGKFGKTPEEFGL